MSDLTELLARDHVNTEPAYIARPADHNFPDGLAGLVTAAAEDKQLSAERSYSMLDLRAEATDSGVALKSPRGLADFTHWSFGQFSRMVGAPASYLRELPAPLAAECLNHGIESCGRLDAVLLAKAPNGNPRPVIRAATSDSYGRLWDADLYSALDVFATRDGWTTTIPSEGRPVVGKVDSYRGDRDSTVTLIKADQTVNDPSSNYPCYRALRFRNSEVGSASVQIIAGILRAQCANLQIWAFDTGTSYRRRHVGSRVLRDVIREVHRVARAWASRPAETDEQIIRALIDREMGSSRAALVAEVHKAGATKQQAGDAFDRCEQYETIPPTSYWGIVQGLTRLSQETSYQDERNTLDHVAGQVLQRGTRLIES